MLSDLHEVNSPDYRPLPRLRNASRRTYGRWKHPQRFSTSFGMQCLAVADRLRSRGLGLDLRCKDCGQAPEIICHVLFICPTAVEVWRNAYINAPPAGFSQNSVFLILHFLVACLRKPQLVTSNIRAFPWILWNLWKNRNALVFESWRTTAASASCVSEALEEADAWYHVNEETKDMNLAPKETFEAHSSWGRPAPGFIKCNVGMAWNGSSILSGASWLTRDGHGCTLHHSRPAFPSPFLKRETDLQALLWPVEAMGNMKQKNIIIETSSVEVREVLLNMNSYPELKYLTDHLPLLLQGLEDWSINHVLPCRTGLLPELLTALSKTTVLSLTWPPVDLDG